MCSIYNDIVPPRRDFSDWLTVRAGQTSMPLSSANISYWGHYPVADLVAEFDELPLRVGVRAFSPFIVGDSAGSNLPAALFEIEVSNESPVALDVTLSVTPPAPPQGKHEQVALLGDGLQTEFDGKRLRGTLALSLAPGQSRRGLLAHEVRNEQVVLRRRQFPGESPDRPRLEADPGQHGFPRRAKRNGRPRRRELFQPRPGRGERPGPPRLVEQAAYLDQRRIDRIHAVTLRF